MNLQVNNNVSNYYEEHPAFKILAQLPMIGSFVQYACIQGIDAKLEATQDYEVSERIRLLDLKKQYCVDGMWRNLYAIALSISLAITPIFSSFFTLPGVIVSVGYNCFEFCVNAYYWYTADKELYTLKNPSEIQQIIAEHLQNQPEQVQN